MKNRRRLGLEELPRSEMIFVYMPIMHYDIPRWLSVAFETGIGDDKKKGTNLKHLFDDLMLV